MPRPKPFDVDAIILDQENWISKRFGEDAAKRANYGWFIDEPENEVGTKIYGHGVLVTTEPGKHVYTEVT